MTEYYGGLWEDTKRKGCERHHPWAWDTLEWLTSVGYDESAVVQMLEKDHHKGTYSFGGDFHSKPGQYRQWQAEEFIRGNFWTVWEVDKQRIRSLFGDKYDKAFEQAETQARKLEAEGKLKVDAEKLNLYRERQELEGQKQLAKEKLDEANAKKYQSEVEKQREVEQAKAEKARVETLRELNRAKLEERHYQLQKEHAEKQLAEAREKSQAEEVKRHEQTLQKETANLKEAETVRKEAEARVHGKLEEYTKQQEALRQQEVRDLQERVKQLEAEVQQREVHFAKVQSELQERVSQLEQRDRALIEAVRTKEQLFQAQQEVQASAQSPPSSGGEPHVELKKDAPQEKPKDLDGLHTHPHLIYHEMQGGTFHTGGIPLLREEAQFDPVGRVVTGVERALREYLQQRNQVEHDKTQELTRTSVELQQLQQESSRNLDVYHAPPPQQKRFEFEIGR